MTTTLDIFANNIIGDDKGITNSIDNSNWWVKITSPYGSFSNFFIVKKLSSPDSLSVSRIFSIKRYNLFDQFKMDTISR